MVILTNSIILPTTTTTDNEERQETLTDSTTLVDAPQKITTTVESTGTDNHQTLMRNNSNNQQIDHPKKSMYCIYFPFIPKKREINFLRYSVFNNNDNNEFTEYIFILFHRGGNTLNIMRKVVVGRLDGEFL